MIKKNLLKKGAIIALSVAMMSVMLTGCGDKKDDKKDNNKHDVIEQMADNMQKTTEEEETEEITTEEVTEEEKEDEATCEYEEVNNFVKAISSADYQAILDMCKLPENSVVCAEDVEYAFLRSEFADLVESQKIEITSSNKQSGVINATLKSGPSTADIKFVLNDDNEFVLDLTDVVYAEKQIRMPHCECIINGVTLNDEWSVRNEDTKVDVIYTVICPTKPMTATITSDFGTYETELTWSDDTNRYSGLSTEAITQEEYDAIMKQIKDDYNAMFQLARDGKTDSTDYAPYFSSNVSPDVMQTTMTWIGNQVNDANDIVMMDLQIDTEKGFVLNQNTAILNVKWKSQFSESKTASDMCWMMIVKENDTYKLYETSLNEETLFTNYFHNEW